ncbi:MAG: tRNA uridine-5-carboxymethylaminomethyl(34) synthesis GTPase MnmE [Bacteroidia bacterium]|nr:tRNA uridine-5-carboxymethylaminomethyl(34) synthesis GTPase MnmE [Bacteroidia bacterium]MDW8158989.1 tRNA uridine-5-carboxymethylaminomethyl(34) synthesis GTPase MnmE [Bacteroidia bacterium]
MVKNLEDTITAIATPPGRASMSVIRVSGKEAIPIVNRIFKGKNLELAAGHSLYYGRIVDPNTESMETIDTVMLALYRAPRSFTREDVVEISCHGNPYILNRVIELLIHYGCRLAEPGEFTMRAFLNGRLDLAQAEAVADLIAANSSVSHKLAIHQLRGGYSKDLHQLRLKLLNFASLLELELDFSEEDVEFANRQELLELIKGILAEIDSLILSFRAGNAIKNGIPTVIAGKPNVGKSTLLNALLNESRAIVSAIPGTTRDIIEDRLFLGGYEFRLTDTAGLRQTFDPIEEEGIRRSHEKIIASSILLYVFDPQIDTFAQAQSEVENLKLPSTTQVVYVANKIDLYPVALPSSVISISALIGTNLPLLKNELVKIAQNLLQTDTVISNQRHLEALKRCHQSLIAAQKGIEQSISSELVAIDIRHALHHLGEITGEVTTEDILENIFSKFCIGK